MAKNTTRSRKKEGKTGYVLPTDFQELAWMGSHWYLSIGEAYVQDVRVVYTYAPESPEFFGDTPGESYGSAFSVPNLMLSIRSKHPFPHRLVPWARNLLNAGYTPPRELLTHLSQGGQSVTLLHGDGHQSIHHQLPLGLSCVKGDQVIMAYAQGGKFHTPIGSFDAPNIPVMLYNVTQAQWIPLEFPMPMSSVWQGLYLAQTATGQLWFMVIGVLLTLLCHSVFHLQWNESIALFCGYMATMWVFMALSHLVYRVVKGHHHFMFYQHIDAIAQDIGLFSRHSRKMQNILAQLHVS